MQKNRLTMDQGWCLKIKHERNRFRSSKSFIIKSYLEKYMCINYCINYVLLQNKLSQNLEAWENKYVSSHLVSKVWESGSCLAGWFWLRSSHEVAIKMSVRVAVIWRLDHAWWVHFQKRSDSHDYWQKDSVPCHVDPSIGDNSPRGCSGHEAGFPWSKGWLREKERKFKILAAMPFII